MADSVQKRGEGDLDRSRGTGLLVCGVGVAEISSGTGTLSRRWSEDSQPSGSNSAKRSSAASSATLFTGRPYVLNITEVRRNEPDSTLLALKDSLHQTAAMFAGVVMKQGGERLETAMHYLVLASKGYCSEYTA